MKKQLLALPLLTLALLLTGCKTTPSNSSSSSNTETPSASSTSGESLESSLTPESSDSTPPSSSETPVEPIGWPTAIIADYIDSFGLDVTVPDFELSQEVKVEYLNDNEYFLDFEYLRLTIENENVVINFNEVLTAAGFYIQEDGTYTAFDASWSLLMIHYYYDEERNATIIDITALVDNIDHSVPPTNPDKNAIFDFVGETQIDGDKNAEKTTWKEGESTFEVVKMEKGIGVGNPAPGKEYYSNPLRLYPGQTVTITAGGDELIEQVKFDVQPLSDQNDKDSIETLTDCAPENVTVSVFGDSITYIFETPVASFSFQISPLTGVQARLYQTTLYFI